MKKYRHLNAYLDAFLLSACPQTGHIGWKHEKGLQMAIIIGKAADGDLYAVTNNPKTLHFELTRFVDFADGKQIYVQDNKTDFYNLRQTARLAFDLLYEFNSYSGIIYPQDFQLQLPRMQTYDEQKVVDFSKGFTTVLKEIGRVKAPELTVKSFFQQLNSWVSRTTTQLATGLKPENSNLQLSGKKTQSSGGE